MFTHNFYPLQISKKTQKNAYVYGTNEHFLKTTNLRWPTKPEQIGTFIGKKQSVQVRHVTHHCTLPFAYCALIISEQQNLEEQMKEF